MTSSKSSQAGSTSVRATPGSVTLAVVLDVVLVFIFAYSGRTSHALGLTALGVLQTAWPFLVGLVLAWLVFRVHRRPMSLVNGMWVWISTVAVGLLLRVATGDGAALPFVLVSIAVIGLFLLGWRLIAVAFGMLSRSPKGT